MNNATNRDKKHTPDPVQKRGKHIKTTTQYLVTPNTHRSTATYTTAQQPQNSTEKEPCTAIPTSYLAKQSPVHQFHSQNMHGDASNLLKLRFHKRTLISSTIASTSKSRFLKIFLFLVLQITQTVVCQISQNPFFPLFILSTSYQTFNLNKWFGGIINSTPIHLKILSHT